jgi:hypothetical protein
MKLLIAQFSSASCCILCLTSKYSPRHHVPKPEKQADLLRTVSLCGCPQAAYDLSPLTATRSPELVRIWKALASRDREIPVTCSVQTLLLHITLYGLFWKTGDVRAARELWSPVAYKQLQKRCSSAQVCCVPVSAIRFWDGLSRGTICLTSS